MHKEYGYKPNFWEDPDYAIPDESDLNPVLCQERKVKDDGKEGKTGTQK